MNSDFSINPDMTTDSTSVPSSFGGRAVFPTEARPIQRPNPPASVTTVQVASRWLEWGILADLDLKHRTDNQGLVSVKDEALAVRNRLHRDVYGYADPALFTVYSSWRRTPKTVVNELSQQGLFPAPTYTYVKQGVNWLTLLQIDRCQAICPQRRYVVCGVGPSKQESIHDACQILLHAVQRDTVNTVRGRPFMEGSFNPYGNGQFIQVWDLNPQPSETPVTLAVFTNNSGGPLTFCCGANQMGIHMNKEANAIGSFYIRLFISDGQPTPTFYSMTVMSYNFLGAAQRFTDHVPLPPFELPNNWMVMLEIFSRVAPVATSGTTFSLSVSVSAVPKNSLFLGHISHPDPSLYGAFPVMSSAVQPLWVKSGASPLWVSEVQPQDSGSVASLTNRASPATQDPPPQPLRGVFNEYGNGQPDHPLVAAVYDLPEPSQDWVRVRTGAPPLLTVADEEPRSSVNAAKQNRPPDSAQHQTKASKTSSPDKKSSTPRQKSHVLARLLKKLRTSSDLLVWLNSQETVDQEFISSLLSRLQSGAAADDWIVRGIAQNKPPVQIYCGLTQWSSSLKSLLATLDLSDIGCPSEIPPTEVRLQPVEHSSAVQGDENVINLSSAMSSDSEDYSAYIVAPSPVPLATSESKGLDNQTAAETGGILFRPRVPEDDKLLTSDVECSDDDIDELVRLGDQHVYQTIQSLTAGDRLSSTSQTPAAKLKLKGGNSLYVRTLGGKHVALPDEASHTFLDSTTWLSTFTGIPSASLRLVFQGRELSSDNWDYFYDSGRPSTAHVLIRLRGGADTPHGWSFPQQMSDIDRYPSLDHLVETDGSPSGSRFDPVRDVQKHVGLSTSLGVAMNTVWSQTAFRGGAVSALNVVDPQVVAPHPEALLYPAFVRTGDAYVAAEAQRPTVVNVGTMMLTAKEEPTLSQLGTTVQSKLMNTAAMAKAVNTSIGGFKIVDLSTLIEAPGVNFGDSMLSCYLKLALYMINRTWTRPRMTHPLSAEVGKFDSLSTIRELNEGITGVRYNNVDAFAEWNLGCENPGLIPNFSHPYDENCTIAFHVTTNTVPAGEPYFFVPTGLLQTEDPQNSGITYALLALALGPYPCGLDTVRLPTADALGAVLLDTDYISFSQLVHIPTVAKRLNFVLPTRTSSAPPLNQADAASSVLVIPTWGPSIPPRYVLPARAPINVNYRGAELFEVSLADFLYSWMYHNNIVDPGTPAVSSPIDPTSLSVFRQNLARCTHRTLDLEFSLHLASCLSVRYPLMVAHNPGAPFNQSSVVDQNGFFRQKSLTYAGLLANQMIDDFCIVNDVFSRIDLSVPALNPVWWNKVVSGMYTVSSDDPMVAIPGSITASSFDGSPALLQYVLHCARKYATTYQLMYVYLGQSTTTLNAAWGNSNIPTVQNMIKGMFATTAFEDLHDGYYAKWGYALANLMSRVTGVKPAMTRGSLTIFDLLNTPRVGYHPPVRANGTPLVRTIPVYIPDVWIWATCTTGIKCLSPFMGPNRMLTGMRSDNHQVLDFGNANPNLTLYSVPVPRDYKPYALTHVELPLHDEIMLFNMRLIWHSYNTRACNYYGVENENNVPLSGQVVCQASQPPDPGTTAQVVYGTLLVASTVWFPKNEADGARFLLGVRQQDNATGMTQAVVGMTQIAIDCWLPRSIGAAPNAIRGLASTVMVPRIPQRPGNSSAPSGLPSAMGGADHQA